MRCPDCGHDFPVKPELIIQKEPCKCGLTEVARNVRVFAFIAVCLILCGLMACLADQYWTTKQIEMLKDSYQIRDKKHADLPEGQKVGLPYDVVPKGK